MKRIARALFHRLPKWAQRRIVGARGVVWKRQIPAFLNARRPAPVRKRPVSVVIPSYNDLPLLKKCLASLAVTLRPDDEVIVVDDYCEERNRAELLKLSNAQTRIILKEERGGFAKTVNVGMAEAQHDIVLLNSDVVALPNWVEYLQEAADSEVGVGLVSAKLLYPDGRIQYGGTFWARSFAPQWFAHRFGGAKFDFAPSNVRRFNWGAGGACMYVTRSAYETLGGLDEEYWLGFEDVDYAMSAWSNGFSSIYEPDAVLFHHESATRGFHQGNRELGSMRTFWRKWRGLHTDRTVDPDKIRVVVAADEEPLWLEYANALSQALGAPLVDAEWVSDEFEGVTLLLSESAFEQVWFSHRRVGLPIALPRDVPERSSERVAAFQPEFDYVVRNSNEQTALEAGIGWTALSVVSPWLRDLSDGALDVHDLELLIVFDVSNAALKDELLSAYENSAAIELRASEPLVHAILEKRPKVVVNLSGWPNELEAIAVLDSGSAVVSPEDSSLQWLLQNGLNCFTCPLEFDAISERLRGLLSEEQSRLDVILNARLTIEASRAISIVKLRNSIQLAVSQRTTLTR